MKTRSKIKPALVRLSKIFGSARANKLFSAAQRVLRSSIPAEERDHGHSIRKWLRYEKAGKNAPSSFEYFVAMDGDRVVGVNMYVVVDDENTKSAVIFGSYVATTKSERGLGIGLEFEK